MSNPEHTSTSREVVGPISPQSKIRSQRRRLSSTERDMVLNTDTDDPGDADELAESLMGITLLEQGNVGGSGTDHDEREEQLEAFGALRAFQKKVIKLADEATAAATSTASQKREALGSDASTQGTRSEGPGIPAQMEAAISRKIRRVPVPRQQLDGYLAIQSEELGATAEAQDVKDGDEMIHFTNTLSSSFEIPYNLVRTWRVSAARTP